MTFSIKKVLFLVHRESDYGGAFLYNGLCEFFGHQSVLDYPRKWSYHGMCDTYSTSWIENGMTCPLAWMPEGYPAPYESLSDEEYDGVIVNMIEKGEIRMVVMESMREHAMRAFKRLEPYIRQYNLPVIVHCGEDYSGFPGHDMQHLNEIKPKLILKREVTSQNDLQPINGAQVVPFPFSLPLNAVAGILASSTRPEIEWDTAFLLGRTHDQRQAVADALRNAKDVHSYVSLQPDNDRGLPNEVHLPWHDYMNLMLRSKCGISTRGFGFDTCHAWETPAVTVLVRDHLGILIPNDFTHGVNCMLYDSPDECVQHVRTLRDNPQLREELYARGYEHLLAYHTTKARIRYMFEYLDI